MTTAFNGFAAPSGFRHYVYPVMGGIKGAPNAST